MMKLVMIAGLAACSAPAAPRPPAPASDPTTDALRVVLDSALEREPDDGVLLYQRASLGGAPDAAILGYLERLDAAGWDIPLAPSDFAQVAATPRFGELAARIAARATVVSRSEVAVTVPEPELIPEGIAVDPETGTLYVGSLRQRRIIAIDRAGAVRPFVPAERDGLLAVTGLRVDRARGLLWACSHASRRTMAHRAPEGTPDGLYAFALADGSLRRRASFPAGEPHLANDVVIASDGTAYLTDSAGGGVYRMPPDRDVLEPVLPANTFVYPNGLALAGDRRLYVADALGLRLVALDTRAIERVTGDHLALGGIDGMVLDGDRLYAVQNSIGRPRVIAVTLDGARATELAVLESDPRALALPTTTALWQGALYTIANTQLDAYGADGLKPGRTLTAPWVLRTPLSAPRSDR